MIKKEYINMHVLGVVFVMLVFTAYSQENYKTVTNKDSTKTYDGGAFYNAKSYVVNYKNRKPKNVILMIGDGMGLSHVFAGMTANGNHLFLENFKHIGFSKTQSANGYITDSAAGGTALSCGEKTYNGAIGMNLDTIPIENIREYAEGLGKATCIVSTSAITHATPASFVAHQRGRTMYEEIATDFLKTNIDLFIGGGYKHFSERKDGQNLIDSLQSKGYKVLTDIKKIEKVTSGKLAGLTAAEHNGRVSEREDMLPKSTKTALGILDNDKDGFFLMVEGSQIDWGGHQNNTCFIVEEMLDFDRAIGVALEFAAKDKNTLIIITADHETGGFSVLDGNMETGMVTGAFNTGHHTGVAVPIFAFGPRSENFTGFMENTSIFQRIKMILK
jgi:alkaline phosphatase